MGCCEIVFHFMFLLICVSSLYWRYLIGNGSLFYLEYETWCVLVEACYYLLQTIIGCITLCSKSSKNCVQDFLKYTLFKLIFAPILACPVIFFLGYNLGWFYFYVDFKKLDFWCDMMNHIIAPGCVLLDVLLFGRKYSPSNLFDIIIITAIYAAYTVLCLPFQTNNVYDFITNGKGFVICAAVVFYCIGIVMHFFYITITKIRNCGKVES